MSFHLSCFLSTYFTYLPNLVIYLHSYLSSYISRLSDNTLPLRQLLHKDVEFQWNDEQQQAFDKLKELVTSATHLQYFNPKKPAVVQVDASMQLAYRSRRRNRGGDRQQRSKNDRIDIGDAVGLRWVSLVMMN